MNVCNLNNMYITMMNQNEFLLLHTNGIGSHKGNGEREKSIKYFQICIKITKLDQKIIHIFLE